MPADITTILRLSDKVILAPLAGISSLAFRRINREFGCNCAFLEMIHARSLCHKSRKTLEALNSSPSDRPLGIQLLADDPDLVEKAMENIRDMAVDIIDFNSACPQRKVTSKGEGAALLKDLPLLSSILKRMVKCSPGLPVTVKLRLGWDSASEASDIALCAQDAGVNAVFVHGRTKAQGYSGDIDYASIGKIKKALNVPLIASGNIFNPSLAKKMFDETGCDGIIVARGSFGNPWIFREIRQMVRNGTVPERPSIEEVADVMTRHFNFYLEYSGERRSVANFRKFYVWYTRGVSGIKQLRGKVMHVKTTEKMLEIIEEFRMLGKTGSLGAESRI